MTRGFLVFSILSLGLPAAGCAVMEEPGDEAELEVVLCDPQCGGLGRDFGDVVFLASVPNPPGYPEGIAVWEGEDAYVSAPASFGNAGDGNPSAVFKFDVEDGELERTYLTQGENLALDHLNAGVAFDGEGRLYVSNTQKGIMRINVSTGAQETFAPWPPNIPPCSSSPPPCSPTAGDNPPLIADVAFDDSGNMFATDLWQATIWRRAKGSNTWTPWFQDARLDTPILGPNCIRINPARTRIYFSVSWDPQFLGRIYYLPLQASPPPATALKLFHTYVDEIPDGIAWGKNGTFLYVALKKAGLGISILRASDGTEFARLANPNGDPSVPFDSPANIAFKGDGTIVVTNHAVFTGNPASFGVLDVYVADKGSPLPLPCMNQPNGKCQ